MFVACWSCKGGSGTTVVTAALGAHAGPARQRPAVLVDLGGDLPAVLGLPEPDGPGLVDWFVAGAAVPAARISRLEIPVVDGLTLIPRGRGPLDAVEGDGRARSAGPGRGVGRRDGRGGRSVVVDCGMPQWSDDGGPLDAAAVVARAATDSLLVTRSCYLALRRAVALGVRPTGVVLLVEPGRALGRPDVEAVLGCDVVAEVAVDPSVGRAVDAGLLTTRLPRLLERALRRAA